MATSGIYQIKNTLNNNRYIGSTANIQRRWNAHLNMLRRKHHGNSHLQRAFNKYGEEAFIFEVLEKVEPENLIEHEQYFLDIQKPEYNILLTAGSSLGYRHTEEAKQKSGKAGERNPNYGKSPSAETRARQSAANMGKHHSIATLTKMSAAKTGERHPMYGKHHSVKTIAKMRAAKLGERNPMYGKTGKQSPMYGKHPSAEARAKMSVATTGERNPNYGKSPSAEAKQKMSIARKAYWRKKREEAQEI